jgi:hypothetical protein
MARTEATRSERSSDRVVRLDSRSWRADVSSGLVLVEGAVPEEEEEVRDRMRR